MRSVIVEKYRRRKQAIGKFLYESFPALLFAFLIIAAYAVLMDEIQEAMLTLFEVKERLLSLLR